MNKILLILSMVLMCACAGTKSPLSPKEKFIREHYADLMAARKKTARDAMMNWPSSEIFKFFDTLKKIGIYDANQDQMKMMNDYMVQTKSEKEKKITEIEKSNKKYEHSFEIVDEAVTQCAAVMTELSLPGAAEAAGEAFFEGKTQLPLLRAMNEMLCACAMAKYAPIFSPQTLKDYSEYVKNGQLIITKNEAYKQLTGESYEDDMPLLFYFMAANFNALDDDRWRVMDASVLGYFMAIDDEECLADFSKIVERSQSGEPK